MLKKLFYIIALLLFSLNNHAQPPGYVSKRLSFSYNNSFFPALRNANNNHTEGITSISYQNAFSLDYVLTRTVSFGLTYRFFKTNFDFKQSFDYSDIDNNGYSVYRDFYLANSVFCDINVKSYGFSWKFFYEKNISAPLGKYIGLDFSVVNYSISYNQNDLEKEWKWQYDLPEFEYKNSYTNFLFTLSRGKQSIIYKKFIINTAFESGIYFGGITEQLILLQSSPNSYDLNEENYMKENANARLFNDFFFKFKLGIGILVH